MPENFEQIFREATTNFKVMFFAGLEEGARFDDLWLPLIYRPSELEIGSGGKLLWSEMQARMKRFGQGHPRSYVELDAYSQFLIDERLGLGFKCDRDKWNADTIGLLMSASRQLGFAAPKTKLRDATLTLLSGFTELCFDGATFFSTSHPYTDDRGKTQFQTNRYQLLLNRENWILVWKDFLARRRINGDILQPTEFMTIAGPDYAQTLIELFDAAIDEQGQTNTLRNRSKYKVHPLLTGEHADKWFVQATDLGSDIKPLAHLESEPPSLHSIIDPTDPFVRRYNEYEWIVDGKYVFDLWQYYAISGSEGPPSP